MWLSLSKTVSEGVVKRWWCGMYMCFYRSKVVKKEKKPKFGLFLKLLSNPTHPSVNDDEMTD